jgi:hypothetical protein
MKVIAQRLWTEPAAAIGLLTSLLLLALALVSGADWDASVIAGIAAPFVSALGIRQTVSPAAGPRTPETTYQASTEPLTPEERPAVFGKETEEKP